MSDVKIKELDKSLIHRANSNSMGVQRGDISAHEYDVYLTFKRRGGTWRYAGRCFEGSAEPVQKYQSSLERMMLTRCKLLGCIAQEVEV